MVGKNKGGGGGRQEANIKETRVLRDQLIILAVGGGDLGEGQIVFRREGVSRQWQSVKWECRKLTANTTLPQFIAIRPTSSNPHPHPSPSYDK